MRLDWWNPDWDEDPEPRRSDACRCGNDMPGRCPGPANCPMCEEDDSDFDQGN